MKVVALFRPLPHLLANRRLLSPPRKRSITSKRCFCSSRTIPEEIPFVPASETELRSWLSSNGVDPARFGPLPGSKTTADLLLEVERGESELFRVQLPCPSSSSSPPSSSSSSPLPLPPPTTSTALRRVRVALVRVTRSSDKATLREVWQRLPPEGRRRSRPELSSSGSGLGNASVAEKAQNGESFVQAAARGLLEELGIDQEKAEEALVAAGAASEEEEEEEAGGGGSKKNGAWSEERASASSYPGLPCRYDFRLFVAEVDGSLLPEGEFFEREEETAKGTLLTRWEWVK